MAVLMYLNEIIFILTAVAVASLAAGVYLAITIEDIL